MCLDGLLKPLELLLVNVHLVRGVGGIAEHRRADAHNQRLRGHHVGELGGLLAEDAQVRLKVLLVRLELVDALEVVVAAHNVEGDAKAVKILAHQREALTCARVQLLGLGAVLRLAEVTKGDEEGVGGVLEDGLHVLTALEGVLQVTRVHVQIAQDAQGEGGGVRGVPVQGGDLIVLGRTHHQGARAQRRHGAHHTGDVANGHARRQGGAPHGCPHGLAGDAHLGGAGRRLGGLHHDRERGAQHSGSHFV
mmetsp:Transcript_26417/g.57363  ORF Transcript_26417/g.57363 Transcript_26417/m.57363 type:complete len:250 (-) Transcript_26417:69-818(-)